MSDGESIKHSSSTSSPSSELTNGESHENTTPRNQEECLAFDLADPGDVERKLEDLSEQEMEDLLKQAYKVNMELKKELARQDREESAGQRGDKSKKTKPQKSGSSSRSSASGTGSLPPIRTPSGSKTAPRGFTTLNHRTNSQLYASSPVSSSRAKYF